MFKKQMIVLGLSATPASQNAYALILKEVGGKRRLPIIIGAFEAQAIALELEGVIPPRPLTHDLIKNLLELFNANLSEVYINELREGTFFAKLIFDEVGLELDARPSDAIALAVRFKAPIYVNDDVLDETGIIPQGEEADFPSEEELKYAEGEDFNYRQPSKPKSKLDYLKMQLDKAVRDEDYEKAANLRDEINKFSEKT